MSRILALPDELQQEIWKNLFNYIILEISDFYSVQDNIKILIQKTKYKRLDFDPRKDCTIFWKFCDKIINNKILLSNTLHNKEFYYFKYAYNKHKNNNKLFKLLNFNDSFVTTMIFKKWKY